MQKKLSELKLFKAIKEYIIDISLKNPINEERAYLALTIITGITSALVAVSLYKLVGMVTNFAGTNTAFTLQSFSIGLILIFVSGWITTRKFPNTSGSGIPGVRVALAVFHGNIAFVDTAAKFIVSVLSLGSGVSLGERGPLPQYLLELAAPSETFFIYQKKELKH